MDDAYLSVCLASCTSLARRGGLCECLRRSKVIVRAAGMSTNQSPIGHPVCPSNSTLPTPTNDPTRPFHARQALPVRPQMLEMRSS